MRNIPITFYIFDERGNELVSGEMLQYTMTSDCTIDITLCNTKMNCNCKNRKLETVSNACDSLK